MLDQVDQMSFVFVAMIVHVVWLCTHSHIKQ